MIDQHCAPRASRAARATCALARRFGRNSDGATAIEFAIVLAPFLAFVFGIITIGLHYLATNSLEKAVFDASRQIRVGKAQKDGMSSAQFKQLVCNEAKPHIDCSKLEIHVSSQDSWANIAPPTCVGGDMNLSSGGNDNTNLADKTGGASKKVIVTACYDWTVAKYLPYLLFDRNGTRRSASPLASGGMLLQASTVFQTEPYE